MNSKEYNFTDGRTAVFEYDENGIGKITLECMDVLMDMITKQWIPCSERLPEYDKNVLCYTDAEEFIVGYRVDNWGQDAWITGEFGDGEFNAIAWMPLPEPYTEEEQ